jgi:glutamyl-tRNA synthetase
MADKRIRVRFAPSPTGPLHIGGVRTAIYNYLFARHYGGDFILRIEDTDQSRFVQGAEQYIIDSLKWCGLTFDEGVQEGGQFGPYRQSDRKAVYREFVDELIRKGKAYYAFDTPMELEALRQEAEKTGDDPFQYDASSRRQMKNSLTLPRKEVTHLLDSGAPYVVRFLIPEDEEVVIEDLIRGEIRVNSNTLDDKVLFKSDGMPTYHLAHMVDDHLMWISHVIRGEEWLPSLPLHKLLYDAFGWELPAFAHLPLLLKPSGKGKLSKRDGDQLGFPVFPLEWKSPSGELSSGYRESGYFPEAFVNLLVLLGWNPGTDREIFSLEELIREFSLNRVGKSGSRFDPEKARWFNHQYLMKKTVDEIVDLFLPLLQKKDISTSRDKVRKIIDLTRERVNFVHEMWDHTWFFFQPPSSYDPQVVSKKWTTDTPAIMNRLKDVIAATVPFSASVLEQEMKKFLSDNGLSMGQVMNAFRLCLVGTGAGPGLFDICEILGRDEVNQRIERAVQTLGK